MSGFKALIGMALRISGCVKCAGEKAMLKTEVKLLDCPFCGQIDNNDSIRLEDATMFVNPSELYWIECHSCSARGPQEKTQERAIEAWQRYPVHYAGEELTTCDKCAGTGQWYKEKRGK